MEPLWDAETPEEEPAGTSGAEANNRKPERKRVRTVRPGETLSAILLDQPKGVWTHWPGDQKPTRPCTGQECSHCQAELPRQHCYYASAMVWERVGADGAWGWQQCI